MEAKDADIKTVSIDQLIPDDKNFNKGTEFGSHLMDESLRKFGLGRSILIDKNNRIIAGNKTAEKAGELVGSTLYSKGTHNPSAPLY